MNEVKMEQTDKDTVLCAIPQEYLHYNEDEPNLKQIFFWFKERWLRISIMTIIGMIISVFIALAIPKTYKSSALLSLPRDIDVNKLNINGLVEYTPKSLFYEFYDEVRSSENLRYFIINNQFLNKLYTEEQRQSKTDIELVTSFIADFNVQIIEPVAERREFIDFPTKIEVSFQYNNEQVIVDMLNRYISYTDEKVLSEMLEQQTELRDLQVERAKNKIDLRREDAKNRRDLEIKKRTVELDKKIKTLELERKLLIEKAKSDREVTINIQESDNKVALRKLEQRRDILLNNAAKARIKEIAEAKEARKIALSLGIENPTRIDDLAVGKEIIAEGGTEIRLAESQSLPLYLMGSRYIDSLIKTLQEREGDEEFLLELAQLDGDIKQIKDDVALQSLKERENDERFIEQLNLIDKELEGLKNDTTLEELKSRESDDAFIDDLPVLQAEIASLENISFDFASANAMVINRAAYVTKKAISPNRKLIAIIGTIFSFMLALVIAFIQSIANEESQISES